MATYLDAIIESHRKRAAMDSRVWQERLENFFYEGPSLRERIAGNSDVAVIAEVKRASPSKGLLAEDLDVEALARLYEDCGATGISVLTDVDYFQGSEQDLRLVTSASKLPVLRKDFTVCENDVIDAAEWGASTVLLIAAALSDDELEQLLSLAGHVGLDALVEVHDLAEINRALTLSATFIGINQRNLHTFKVDPQHAASLVEAIPTDIVTVCESGLRSVDDVRFARDAGFDAVLVGETFVTAIDARNLVTEFSSVSKIAGD